MLCRYAFYGFRSQKISLFIVCHRKITNFVLFRQNNRAVGDYFADGFFN